MVAVDLPQHTLGTACQRFPGMAAHLVVDRDGGQQRMRAFRVFIRKEDAAVGPGRPAGRTFAIQVYPT